MSLRYDETRFPGLFAAAALLLLVLGLQCAGGTLDGALDLLLGRLGWELGAGWKPVLTAINNALAFAVVLSLGWRLCRAPLRDLFPLRPVGLVLLPMMMTAVGVHILLSDVDNLFRFFFPLPPFVRRLYADLFSSDNLWGSLLLMVGVAPVSEELFFRGLLLRGFLTRYRPWVAVVVSAALFSIFHLNPWQMVGAFLLGLLFGWWVVNLRSLWPPLLAHALNNGASALASRLPFQVDGYTTGLADATLFQPWWFNALGGILASVGILWTALHFRRATAAGGGT